MSWSINTRDISSISTFADAQRVFDRTTPWRGAPTEWRQLGNRRAQHKRIVKTEEGYECVLYNTAVVTYYEDMSVKLECHDSQSTSAFAWCVRPAGAKPVSSQGRMFWEVQTDKGKEYYRGTLVLKPTEKGNWLLTTKPEPIVEWAHDRTKAAAVRKVLKPFAAWYKLVEQMTGIKKGYAPLAFAEELDYFLAHSDEVESYSKFITHLGDPLQLKEALYLHTGAKYKTPVPTYRLPRTYA